MVWQRESPFLVLCLCLSACLFACLLICLLALFVCLLICLPVPACLLTSLYDYVCVHFSLSLSPFSFCSSFPPSPPSLPPPSLSFPHFPLPLPSALPSAVKTTFKQSNNQLASGNANPRLKILFLSRHRYSNMLF